MNNFQTIRNVEERFVDNSIIHHYLLKIKTKIGEERFEKIFFDADFSVLKNAIKIVFSSFQKYNFAKRRFLNLLNDVCKDSWPKSDISVLLDFKKCENEVTYEKNSSKTFENFIEDDYNKIPYEILKNISMYSDLEIIKSGTIVFLHSKYSCGKTHLLQASYNSYKNLSNKVEYITSEGFASKFAQSVKENNVFDFRNNLLKNDILLIDDFQFFQGKKATLKELEFIISDMINNNKYIVIGSSFSVESYSFLPDRLFNFIRSSFSINIQSPSRKIKDFFFSKVLDKEGLSYKWIMEKEFLCVRSIKSISEKISALKIIGNKKSISINEIKEIYSDSFSDSTSELVNYNLGENIQKIQSYIAKYCGISHSDLISKKRSKRISVARSVAIYVVKKITDINYNDMGIYFGNRNYSTLVNSVKFIESFIIQDIFIKDEINSIINRLTNKKD